MTASDFMQVDTKNMQGEYFYHSDYLTPIIHGYISIYTPCYVDVINSMSADYNDTCICPENGAASMFEHKVIGDVWPC